MCMYVPLTADANLLDPAAFEETGKSCIPHQRTKLCIHCIQHTSPLAWKIRVLMQLYQIVLTWTPSGRLSDVNRRRVHG